MLTMNPSMKTGSALAFFLVISSDHRLAVRELKRQTSATANVVVVVSCAASAPWRNNHQYTTASSDPITNEIATTSDQSWNLERGATGATMTSLLPEEVDDLQVQICHIQDTQPAHWCTRSTPG